MKPRHRVSPAALTLIKRFEGLRHEAARLPDGRWTIGYGHTKTAREGAEVSEQDAEALLVYDLIPVAAAVNDWTFTPLTQNQFDALVSFASNVGLENFRRSSVLRRVNEGALLQAACALEMWRKADFEGERILVDALVRRRAAEKVLFLTPPDGWVPAPTPVVRPELDYGAALGVPHEWPANLTPALDGADAAVTREPSAEPEPDDGYSPSLAAAAAVSARLQALVPEESPESVVAKLDPGPTSDEVVEEAPAEADVMEPPALAADTDAVAALEPEPQPAPEPEPEPEPVFHHAVEPTAPEVAELAPTAAEPEPELAAFGSSESLRQIIRRGAPLNRHAPEPVRVRIGFGPLVVLAMIGLGLFGGGVLWAVDGTKVAGGAVFDDPQTLGLILGLVGIACVFTAVYFLLERLSKRDD